MKEIGINMEKVKVNNSASILRLLNQKGPMSKKDIAFELGLTSAAVTILCHDMIDQNIIINKGEAVEERRTGRKKVLIDINYQNKLILSISIQPVYTFLYLCDIKGNPIESERMKTDTNQKPKDFLVEIAEKTENLLVKANTHWEQILGVGVTITGIVDSERGISIHAYGVWEENVPIKEILEESFHVNVTVGNNVKAIAEAELIYGTRKNSDQILFVKWGPGVGSSIAFQSNNYERKGYIAGELGHYIVNPQGNICRCGKRGCLETYVSYQSIVENIKQSFSKENMPFLYEKLKGDIQILETEIIENNHVEELIKAEDSTIHNLIKKSIQILAFSVVNAITILAPNQVIMLSQIFDKEEYFEYFIECCHQIDQGMNEQLIIKSKLEHAINYIGGVAISANQDFFNRGGFSNDWKVYDSYKNKEELICQ